MCVEIATAIAFSFDFAAVVIDGGCRAVAGAPGLIKAPMEGARDPSDH
jgi:hypothetical protein